MPSVRGHEGKTCQQSNLFHNYPWPSTESASQGRLIGDSSWFFEAILRIAIRRGLYILTHKGDILNHHPALGPFSMGYRLYHL